MDVKGSSWKASKEPLFLRVFAVKTPFYCCLCFSFNVNYFTCFNVSFMSVAKTAIYIKIIIITILLLTNAANYTYQVFAYSVIFYPIKICFGSVICSGSLTMHFLS